LFTLNVANQQKHTGKICCNIYYQSPACFGRISCYHHQGALQEHWKHINILPNCISKTARCYSHYLRSSLWL